MFVCIFLISASNSSSSFIHIANSMRKCMPNIYLPIFDEQNQTFSFGVLSEKNSSAKSVANDVLMISHIFVLACPIHINCHRISELK